MRISARHAPVGLLILATVLALGACGDGGGEAAAGEVEREAASGAVVGAGGAAASCVADYASNPCDLLTGELVRGEIAGAPPDTEQDSYSGSSFSSCSYSWPSDRMASREVAGRSIEYPESNSIRLAWIETYETDDPRARFRREYLPTEEEVQRGREMMAERLDEQVQEGELSESQRELAGDMADAVPGGLSFQAVDDVGDMASWSGNTLYVLDGATSFQVEADVSTESREDRDAAVRIATALMTACR